MRSQLESFALAVALALMQLNLFILLFFLFFCCCFFFCELSLFAPSYITRVWVGARVCRCLPVYVYVCVGEFMRAFTFKETKQMTAAADNNSKQS